ncbi:hypothetical protein BJV74DRAFT_831327 [Russula compacta]|nr:hypothetical protein BJV74DRAFT_831327 [Russula compacta]
MPDHAIWVCPSGPENQLLPHPFFLHHPLLPLSFAAFLLPSCHSDSHTFRSCSRSCAPALNLASIALLPTHASRASTMALQLTPSMLQRPVKQACLSSPILSFHQLSLPFIHSPLSSPCLPCVIIKHHPTAIPCVTGTTPAAPNATRQRLSGSTQTTSPILDGLMSSPVNPIGEPELDLVLVSCIARVPAVIFVFTFHCFAFVPLTTLPLCSLRLIPPLPLPFHATSFSL